MRLQGLNKETRDFWKAFEGRIWNWKKRDFIQEARVALTKSLEEKEAILGGGSAPDFDNTIGFLERVDLDYLRVIGDYHALNGLVRTRGLEMVEAGIVKIVDDEERRDLNDGRWARRVRGLWRNSKGLSPERQKLLRDYYTDYKNNGAYLSPDTRAKLSVLNTKLSRLELKFSQGVAREKRHAVFSREGDLAGLGREEIVGAKQLARSLGKKGWAVRLDPTVCQDLARRLVHVKSKLKIMRTATSRGKKLESVAVEIAKTRLSVARLLGFKSWTRFKLSSGCAKRPERVWAVFKRCLPSIHKMVDGDIERVKDSGWDKDSMSADDVWAFLPQDSALPSYEPLKVLEKGCFVAAGKLFGLRFDLLEDAKTYHEDTRTYAVSKGKKVLGFIIADFWQREGKDNGAWALAWEGQRSKGQFPVVSICFNFAKLGECEFSGVSTIFHEFGHALHAIFTANLPPSHSGLDCSNDFVETPSQLAEYWAYDKKIYGLYKSSGSPAYDDILKIEPGTGLTYLASIISASADLIWHSEEAARIKSTTSVDYRARRVTGGVAKPVGPRYKSSYFEHIFNCGYDASYFSYLWCELKAGQINKWVKENGGLCRRTGNALLQHVFQAGGDRKSPGDCPLWKGRRGRLVFENF